MKESVDIYGVYGKNEGCYEELHMWGKTGEVVIAPLIFAINAINRHTWSINKVKLPLGKNDYKREMSGQNVVFVCKSASDQADGFSC